MPPRHNNRRSIKGSVQHPTDSHHRSPIANAGPDQSPIGSSMKSPHKKSGKRKLGQTGKVTSASNGEHGEEASSSSNVPEQNFSSVLTTSSSSEHVSPGASSTVRSDAVWKFRGQSTQDIEEPNGLLASNDSADVIETDAVRIPATVSSAHQNHHRTSMEGASGDESVKKSSVAGAQGGEQATANLASGLSDEASLMLIHVVAYVMSMLPENVKECMLNLIRQGVTVTRENLLDECLKNSSRFGRSGENFPSFPQRVSPSGSQTTSTSRHPVSGDGRTSGSGRGTSTSIQGAGALQSPASMNSRSEDQVDGHNHQQHSANQRNPSEDVVDGGVVDQAQTNGKYSNSSKMNGRSAAYYSPINNVSSQSSAKDFGPATDAASGASKTTSSSGAGSGQTVTSTAGSSSVGSNVSSGQMSTSSDSPATTADSSATLQDAQNDLNKESSPAAQKDAEPSNQQPLKERDPNKHLQTCLQLVREEYKRLDIARHCGECGNNPRDITFLPCGHVWACRSCAVPLYVCPCCDKNIIATVDTYLC